MYVFYNRHNEIDRYSLQKPTDEIKSHFHFLMRQEDSLLDQSDDNTDNEILSLIDETDIHEV